MSRRLAPVALLWLLAGCWTVPGGIPRYHDPIPAAYARALAAHTRSAHVYRDFAQTVAVVATLETPDFLEARFAEDGRIHDLGAAASSARLTAFEAAHPGPTAVIYMEAARPGWLDLGGLDHTWRVALVVGGHAYDATHLETLDDEDPTVRHLFPYVQTYGGVWRAEFPPAAATGLARGATLIVAGAPAQVKLAFPPAR